MTPQEMLAYERIRPEVIRIAVAAVDDVLLRACCGNPEVYMRLSGEVAAVFVEKIEIMLQAEVGKKEMLCEIPPEVFKHFYQGAL